jgi:hypothetical protein
MSPPTNPGRFKPTRGAGGCRNSPLRSWKNNNRRVRTGTRRVEDSTDEPVLPYWHDANVRRSREPHDRASRDRSTIHLRGESPSLHSRAWLAGGRTIPCRGPYESHGIRDLHAAAAAGMIRRVRVPLTAVPVGANGDLLSRRQALEGNTEAFVSEEGLRCDLESGALRAEHRRRAEQRYHTHCASNILPAGHVSPLRSGILRGYAAIGSSCFQLATFRLTERSGASGRDRRPTGSRGVASRRLVKPFKNATHSMASAGRAD